MYFGIVVNLNHKIHKYSSLNNIVVNANLDLYFLFFLLNLIAEILLKNC